jgi:hypothetical protein
VSAQAEIDALLDERRGYVVRGLPDRVKAVDEQLARLGYRAPQTAQAPTPEKAVAPKPTRGRKGSA